MNLTQAFQQTLFSSLTGEPLSGASFSAFTHEDWEELYQLAKKHDLCHLTGDALLRAKLLPEEEKALGEKLRAAAVSAVFRTQRIAADLKSLRAVLSASDVPCIFLKGSVLRDMYPAPWMRTSCDIDLLVREEDLERAKALLEEKLSYVFENKGDHDIGAFGPSRIHLELHYKLIEGEIQGKTETLLAEPWRYASPTGSGSEWAFSDEFFYYYYLAHTSKHFVHGGCGVRPLIDLWIMRRSLPDNTEKREALLDRGGLLTFAEKLEKLSRVWFEGEEPDELTENMESYILAGGVYGTRDQHTVMSQVREGSRGRHVLQRLWLPRRLLVTLYPAVEKHPVLIPFCQSARWITRLLEGRGGQMVCELQKNVQVTDDERNAAREFLEKLGLN